jgi:hypothetical protein
MQYNKNLPTSRSWKPSLWSNNPRNKVVVTTRDRVHISFQCGCLVLAGIRVLVGVPVIQYRRQVGMVKPRWNAVFSGFTRLLRSPSRVRSLLLPIDSKVGTVNSPKEKPTAKKDFMLDMSREEIWATVPPKRDTRLNEIQFLRRYSVHQGCTLARDPYKSTR